MKYVWFWRGDANPSAETIGRGGCFVIESFLLFYDELYLKAFHEKKKNKTVYGFTWYQVSLMNGQLLSKALAFIIELFKYIYMSTRKNWDFSCLLRGKNVPDLEHIRFSVLASTSKSRAYCIYEGHLVRNCNTGPTLWGRIYLYFPGRSALALVKLSLKIKVVWRRNVSLHPVDPWETSFRFDLWLWANLLGLACLAGLNQHSAIGSGACRERILATVLLTSIHTKWNNNLLVYKLDVTL